MVTEIYSGKLSSKQGHATSGAGQAHGAVDDQGRLGNSGASTRTSSSRDTKLGEPTAEQQSC